MKYIITTLLLLACTTTEAQSKKDIETIDAKCRKCLDKGVNMLSCEISRYKEVDNLLNTTYNRLRKQLPPAAFEELNAEQQKWLGQRDAHFKELKAETSEDGGEAEQLSLYSDKSQFVEERISVLMDKFPSKSDDKLRNTPED